MRYRNTALLLALASVLVACSSKGSGSGESSATTPASSGAQANPSAVFVLGDSLSDVGNAAAAADFMLSFAPPYPPTVGLCNPEDVIARKRSCDDLFYRQSRVSNGPVAVEYLADHYGLGALEPALYFLLRRPVKGTDYAVAGAKAREQRRSDLSRQVEMLLADHSRRLPTDALYVVMIGSNDAIDALQTTLGGAPDARQASDAIVKSAVDAIATNVERLLDAGALRLVVANAPDLASLPAVRAKARASGDEAAVLGVASAVSDAFDGELDAQLDRIAASGRWSEPAPPTVTRFDLRAAWREADAAAAEQGKNVVDACFDSDTYRHSKDAERVFNQGCAPEGDGPPRFSEFAFWDNLHPTGAVHAAIGAALVRAVAP